MEIQQIIIYPIKGCAGISLNQVNITELGLEHDRSWILADQKGQFISQRSHPKLCLVNTSIDSEKGLLTVSAVNQASISFDINSTDQYFDIQVWNDHILAAEVDSKVGQWFSELLKIDCRLLKCTSETKRPYGAHPEGPLHCRFVDHSPALFIGEASLNHLNNKLSNKMSMVSFRPSFVVNSDIEHCEDTWKKIKVGEVTWNFVQECGRCIVTCIDQGTGGRGTEPLKTLSTYRKRGRSPTFGSYFAHKQPGVIRLGDEIEIL